MSCIVETFELGSVGKNKIKIVKKNLIKRGTSDGFDELIATKLTS